MNINIQPLKGLIDNISRLGINDKAVYLGYLKQHYLEEVRVVQFELHTTATGEYRPEMTSDLLFSSDDLQYYKLKFCLNRYQNEHNYQRTYLVRDEILRKTLSQFGLEENLLFFSHLGYISSSEYYLELHFFPQPLENKNLFVLKELYFKLLCTTFLKDVKRMLLNTKVNFDLQIWGNTLTTTYAAISQLFIYCLEKYKAALSNGDSDVANYFIICQLLSKELNHLKDEFSLELRAVKRLHIPSDLTEHAFTRNNEGFAISILSEWKVIINRLNSSYLELRTEIDSNLCGTDFISAKHSDDFETCIQLLSSSVESFKAEIKSNLNYKVFSTAQVSAYLQGLLSAIEPQINWINDWFNIDSVFFCKSTESAASLVIDVNQLDSDATLLKKKLQPNLKQFKEIMGKVYCEIDYRRAELRGFQLLDQFEVPNPTPAAYKEYSHYKAHRYTITLFLDRLSEIEGTQQKYQYMREAIDEYNSVFGERKNSWGNSFAEQVEHELFRAKRPDIIVDKSLPVTLKKLRINFSLGILAQILYSLTNEIASNRKKLLEAENSEIMNLVERSFFGTDPHESDNYALSLPRLTDKVCAKWKWNGAINLLVDIFYQLSEEIEVKGKKALEAEKADIAAFLFHNFIDRNGHELSQATLLTVLAHTRSDKRPKPHKRINVSKFFTER